MFWKLRLSFCVEHGGLGAASKPSVAFIFGPIFLKLVNYSVNIFEIPINPLYLCTILVYRMTEEDKKLLDIFDGKLKHLLFLYEKLQEENASLRKLLSDKENELVGMKNSLKDLEVRYADLQSARILSVHDNELRDTKTRLAKLVREVDKCIALLSE